MGKRIAALFGNNYERYPENELRGCHNDVRNMATELIRAGMFRDHEVARHLDAADPSESDPATTRLGMMRELAALAMRTQTEDVELVYVHYSGHGDKLGRRRCILPSDFEDYPGDDGVIIDDWLSGWALTCHQRTRLVVVFDCCYSGNDLELQPRRGRKVTFLSGCTVDQTSEDAAGIDARYEFTGALTTCMVQTLQAEPALFDDVLSLLERMKALLRRDHFRQTPVLTSTHSLRDDPTFLPSRRQRAASTFNNPLSLQIAGADGHAGGRHSRPDHTGRHGDGVLRVAFVPQAKHV